MVESRQSRLRLLLPKKWGFYREPERDRERRDRDRDRERSFRAERDRERRSREPDRDRLSLRFDRLRERLEKGLINSSISTRKF